MIQTVTCKHIDCNVQKVQSIGMGNANICSKMSDNEALMTVDKCDGTKYSTCYYTICRCCYSSVYLCCSPHLLTDCTVVLFSEHWQESENQSHEWREVLPSRCYCTHSSWSEAQAAHRVVGFRLQWHQGIRFWLGDNSTSYMEVQGKENDAWGWLQGNRILKLVIPYYEAKVHLCLLARVYNSKSLQLP